MKNTPQEEEEKEENENVTQQEKLEILHRKVGRRAQVERVYVCVFGMNACSVPKIVWWLNL